MLKELGNEGFHPQEIKKFLRTCGVHNRKELEEALGDHFNGHPTLIDQVFPPQMSLQQKMSLKTADTRWDHPEEQGVDRKTQLNQLFEQKIPIDEIRKFLMSKGINSQEDLKKAGVIEPRLTELLFPETLTTLAKDLATSTPQSQEATDVISDLFDPKNGLSDTSIRQFFRSLGINTSTEFKGRFAFLSNQTQNERLQKILAEMDKEGAKTGSPLPETASPPRPEPRTKAAGAAYAQPQYSPTEELSLIDRELKTANKEWEKGADERGLALYDLVNNLAKINIGIVRDFLKSKDITTAAQLEATITPETLRVVKESLIAARADESDPLSLLFPEEPTSRASGPGVVPPPQYSPTEPSLIDEELVRASKEWGQSSSAFGFDDPVNTFTKIRVDITRDFLTSKKITTADQLKAAITPETLEAVKQRLIEAGADESDPLSLLFPEEPSSRASGSGAVPPPIPEVEAPPIPKDVPQMPEAEAEELPARSPAAPPPPPGEAPSPPFGPPPPEMGIPQDLEGPWASETFKAAYKECLDNPQKYIPRWTGEDRKILAYAFAMAVITRLPTYTPTPSKKRQTKLEGEAIGAASSFVFSYRAATKYNPERRAKIIQDFQQKGYVQDEPPSSPDSGPRPPIA
jgi:DNA-binding transcriptional MerR regulator